MKLLNCHKWVYIDVYYDVLYDRLICNKDKMRLINQFVDFCADADTMRPNKLFNIISETKNIELNYE